VLAKNGGSVVNIGSINAADPGGVSVYGATKAPSFPDPCEGVEWAKHNIRPIASVRAFHTALTDSFWKDPSAPATSRSHLHGTPGTTDELVGVALLLPPCRKLHNGRILYVDGGLLAGGKLGPTTRSGKYNKEERPSRAHNISAEKSC
jgi:NAD(P)-dependent dehydrogenase (short-subunit alcohol dehydrogenase family)